MKVEFIKPKDKNLKRPNWQVSERTLSLVKAYSEYCDYSEGEVIDMFLENLKKDEKFIEWALKKRNNKRLLKVLDIETGEEMIG
ncbi:hypothetical protein ABE25_13725 [Cytobacillus firmus]|nr:hypothetical protein [Cytobacillus firmus]MBG9603190.1 hypothetical protein [Cytobacillus firmus]